MDKQSPVPAPPVPETELDITNRNAIADFILPHFREEDEFIAYATKHFPGTDYNKIEFTPYSVQYILDRLRVDPTVDAYKRPFKSFLVKMADDDCRDNDKLEFTIIPAINALQFKCTVFFPMLLFICILEFFKIAAPGDRINSDIEFSWGERLNPLTGVYVVTIIFRFKLDDGTWQFYDYSSEYPDHYKMNIKRLKTLFMNA